MIAYSWCTPVSQGLLHLPSGRLMNSKEVSKDFLASLGLRLSAESQCPQCQQTGAALCCQIVQMWHSRGRRASFPLHGLPRHEEYKALWGRLLQG